LQSDFKVATHFSVRPEIEAVVLSPPLVRLVSKTPLAEPTRSEVKSPTLLFHSIDFILLPNRPLVVLGFLCIDLCPLSCEVNEFIKPAIIRDWPYLDDPRARTSQ
jgi:hypothetical protein